MDPMIFLEKVRQPERRGVVRRRLVEAVDGTDGNATACLLLAPAGSGKTTLLSHLAGTGCTPVAWYRASAEDADEASLVQHLGYSVGAALGLPELAGTGAPGRVDAFVRALEVAAGSVGESRGASAVRLVVDDVQEILGSPAEEALERFLLLRPRAVRVLLASRRPPSFDVSRLLVSGELHQLGGDDLRFRSWEVEELFATVHRCPLGPEAAAALTRRTGGWAAGLHLFHLATATLSRPDRERAVHELGGRTRLLRSYLTRNVLAGLAARRLAFLVRTCTLGVLTDELCDALLETSGSGSVLAELEAEQLFTTSTDGGLTFRYHQVLQTHLELLLVEQLGSAAARALYARSGQLLEHAGHRAAAVRAYARGQEWGAVARLLEPGSRPVAVVEGLGGDLSLPGAPTDDPGLVLAGARRLLRLGRVADAVDAFRRAEGLLDDPEFQRRCAVERAAAARWLPGPDRGDLPGSAEDLALAELRRLTRETRTRDGVADGLCGGLAALAAGDVAAAAEVLARVGAETSGSGWEPLAVRLAALVVEVLQAPGPASAERFEAVVLEADVEGWPWLARMGRALQAATLTALEPTPWRTAACTELLAELEHDQDLWALCLACLAVGLAQAVRGADGPAAVAASRAEEVATALEAPVLRAWAVELRRRCAGPADTAARSVDALERPLRLTGTSGRWAPAAPGRVDRAAGARDSTGPLDSHRETTTVVLRCLGGFSLRLDGAEVPTRSLRPRVLHLLLRLALQHGRPAHREQLIDELWPDASLTSGIRSLQVAVSALRRCLADAGLGEDGLRRHGDGYALELPRVLDQVARFEELAAQAARPAGPGQGDGPALEALTKGVDALEVYAGDLLPEVGPAEWVLAERERLRLLAASTAALTARRALDLGEVATGLRAARRAVALDPFRDPAWALLVELCLRDGDRSAAIVARQAQQRVHAELGLDRYGAPGPVPGEVRTGRAVARPRGPGPGRLLSGTTRAGR